MTEYKFREGIQAIVYREEGNKREFLVLHRIKNWVGWEFPKGGTRTNETPEQALIRELKEECGINQKDINAVWPTNTNFRIDYPKEMWEKANYKGAFYKNFIVELKRSAKLTITNNEDELEHDAIKWISESAAAEYLDPKLLDAMNNSILVLKDRKKNC